MAVINLTDQEDLRNQLNPRLAALKTTLNERKPVWDKLRPEKRRAVIANDRDKSLSLAWDMYTFLDNNFFGDKYTVGGRD